MTKDKLKSSFALSTSIKETKLLRKSSIVSVKLHQKFNCHELTRGTIQQAQTVRWSQVCLHGQHAPE